MLVTMTDRELYRLGIIQRVFDRALLQLFMDDATGRLMHLRFCDSENALFTGHLKLNDLAASFTWRELRRVSKSLTVQYFI